VVTFAALGGYFTMTLSPIEGVSFTQAVHGVGPLLSAQLPWIAGGVVTGPVFGFLGHRWRTVRSRIGAAILAGALSLEPAAWASIGRLTGSSLAWTVEVIVGLIAASAIAGRRIVRLR
jgi:hypothetical protein